MDMAAQQRHRPLEGRSGQEAGLVEKAIEGAPCQSEVSTTLVPQPVSQGEQLVLHPGSVNLLVLIRCEGIGVSGRRV